MDCLLGDQQGKCHRPEQPQSHVGHPNKAWLFVTHNRAPEAHTPQGPQRTLPTARLLFQLSTFPLS